MVARREPDELERAIGPGERGGAARDHAVDHLGAVAGRGVDARARDRFALAVDAPAGDGATRLDRDRDVGHAELRRDRRGALVAARAPSGGSVRPGRDRAERERAVGAGARSRALEPHPARELVDLELDVADLSRLDMTLQVHAAMD